MELKTRISQWKQLHEGAQETYLEQYKNLSDTRIKEIFSNTAYMQDHQHKQKVPQENQTVRRKGSSPSAPEDVRDKVTNLTRKDLFKYFFKYIHATTPKTINSRGEDTTSWPVLSACIVIIDEYHPKRCGSGKQKKIDHSGKDKETINIITGSNTDTQVIIQSLQCFTSIDDRKKKQYLFHSVHNEESAIDADNYGLSKICRRTRPKQRAHRFDEIIPRLTKLSKPRVISSPNTPQQYN